MNSNKPLWEKILESAVDNHLTKIIKQMNDPDLQKGLLQTLKKWHDANYWDQLKLHNYNKYVEEVQFVNYLKKLVRMLDGIHQPSGNPWRDLSYNDSVKSFHDNILDIPVVSSAATEVDIAMKYLFPTFIFLTLVFNLYHEYKDPASKELLATLIEFIKNLFNG